MLHFISGLLLGILLGMVSIVVIEYNMETKAKKNIDTRLENIMNRWKGE
jgi:hypothetical protein